MHLDRMMRDSQREAEKAGKEIYSSLFLEDGRKSLQQRESSVPCA